MEEQRINILIVEDDPIISADLSILLEKNGFSVAGIAHDETTAVDKLSNHLDIAILDINLGHGKTGLSIASVIDRKFNFPYIFLTSYSDEFTLSEAKKYCPYGYLVKPFQEATLIATLRIALSTHKKSKIKLNLENLQIQLTDQEKKICSKLFAGLSYQEIADNEFISINTVRYHVKNLYSKFDVSGRSELINKLIQ